MATEFKDCVLTRMHVLSKKISSLTSPDNPTRSPSTRDVVQSELKEPMGELMLLYEVLGRICTKI